MTMTWRPHCLRHLLVLDCRLQDRSCPQLPHCPPLHLLPWRLARGNGVASLRRQLLAALVELDLTQQNVDSRSAQIHSDPIASPQQCESSSNSRLRGNIQY